MDVINYIVNVTYTLLGTTCTLILQAMPRWVEVGDSYVTRLGCNYVV